MTRFGSMARMLAVVLCLTLSMHGWAVAAVTESAETTNGKEILKQSANISCLRYEIVGICVWLLCTPAGCSVETSVKIKHYIPDAVVTSYPVTGKSPWLETRKYAQPNSQAMDGGSNKEGSMVQNTTALIFKNTDVIGSPGTAWIETLQKTGYFCDPSTTAYQPYFLSTLDPNWRNSLIETPWSIRYLFRSVRKGLSMWSGVYPRVGFVHNTHDYKVGAVTAQRAADIVTRKWQPHIYWPMVEDQEKNSGYWPPQEVIEGDEDKGLWQQLIPSSQADECRVFADRSDQASGPLDPFRKRVSQISGYAFNLWRPYRCCEKKGQVLLYHTGD